MKSFVELLRERFADQRDQVDIIAALSTRMYDPKKEYIIDHIDQLLIDMAYEPFRMIS